MRVSLSAEGLTWLRRPQTLRLLAAAFVLDAMTTFFVLAYGSVYLLRELHAPAAYPAIALAIYGAVKLTSAPPGGWLLARHGAGICTAVSFAAGAIGLAVALREHNAASFFIAVGCSALAVSLFWLIVMQSIGVNAADEHRGVAGSVLGVVSIAGTGSGVLLSPVFELFLTPRAAMTLVLAGICVVAALLAFWPAGTAPADRHLARGRVSRSSLPFLFLVLCHFAVLTAVASVYLPFLFRTLDLSTVRALAVVAPGAAAGGLAMLWSGSHSLPNRRFDRATTYYLLGAVALLVTAGESRAALAAILAVPMLGALAATAPLVNAAVLDATRAAAGAEMLGWIFLVEGLGAAIGPAVGAGSIAAFGVRGAMVTASIGLALLAVGLFESRRVRA